MLTAQPHSATAPRNSAFVVGTLFAVTLSLLAPAAVAVAHEANFPIAGKKFMVRTDDGKANRKFLFKSAGDRAIRIANHDPTVDATTLVVNSEGDEPRSTGLINLKAEHWTRIEEGGDLIGWKYKDAAGSNGGVTKVILKNGKLQLKAKGEGWKFKPKGDNGSVWVHFGFEEEEYCSEFSKASGAKVERNKKGHFQASNGVAPALCDEQVCGNGVLELGEDCDDGNLDEVDGCTNACSIGECAGPEFASTYDAIQNVIFDSEVYRCSNDACHGAAKEGDLDLRAGFSYDQLVGFDSPNGGGLRVQLQEPDGSLLFEKLLAKFEDRSASTGSSMPVAAPALSEPHLNALREWIRAGAQRDLVIANTAGLGCQPPADPLKIPVPDPPGDGIGVQLTATPRPLDAQAESEICMSTYFDFTDIVPEGSRFPCPDKYKRKRFCANEPEKDCTTDDDCPLTNDICYTRSFINTEDECFFFHRIEALQDSQSHHSIQMMYAGTEDVTHEGWGEWTYRFDDETNPLQGQVCDPKAIDPALGYNQGCSSSIVDAIACIGYGPPDFTDIFAIFGIDSNAITVNVSQEPIHDFTYADGVFEMLPMKGVMTWNSHAFNLTTKDSTLGQYLNLYYAEPEDQLYPIDGIFDAGSIFIQNVPPFETREYCRTWTAPKNSRVVRLTSHTHRHGTLFRMWGPPNAVCEPKCEPGVGLCFGDPDVAACGGPREDEPFYFSTAYSDPLQIEYDPPIEHDEENVEDRTYYYCAVYDNGSTPTSPTVKQASTSPLPPNQGFTSILGGPCVPSKRSCMAGPNKGELCWGQAEDFCDTSPGAGDGECDACTALGGVTTEDEMFIMLGDLYCVGDGCETDSFDLGGGGDDEGGE